MRTDLHIHTTASDGCWTPERLITGIEERNIQLFAVTDHDSVDSVCQIAMLSRQIPAHFIKGVEINATFQGKTVHILGYGIDPSSPILLDLLLDNCIKLQSANNKDIQNLIDAGYPISYNDYVTYEYDRTRGGWQSLNFLIDQHVCRDLNEYNTLIRPRLGHHITTFESPDDVISVIREADGIPILAHPGASFPTDSLEGFLDQLQDQGIAGVECYAQYHDEITAERCVEWCHSHGLLVTGGSDYHGGFVNRELGVPVLDHEVDLKLGEILSKIV